MEGGLCSWLVLWTPRKELVGPQCLVSPTQNDHGEGSHESWLHHAQQARV